MNERIKEKKKDRINELGGWMDERRVVGRLTGWVKGKNMLQTTYIKYQVEVYDI